MILVPAWLAAVVLAAVPGTIRLWRSAILGRNLDDPALPERLMSVNRWYLGVFFADVAIAVWAFPWPAAIAIVGAAIVGLLAGGFSLRKRLRQETWSFPAFLWFQFRMLIAFGGFLVILFAVGPVAMDGVSGPPRWIVSAALFVGLLAWSEFIGVVIRKVMGTTPVPADTLASFEALAAKANAGPIRFEQIPTRGGTVPNALALPSLRAPTVLFTSTLLDRLDADELLAICAHELAHMEHHDRKKLTRARIANVVVVFAFTLLVPITNQWLPAVSSLVGVLPVVGFWYLIYQLQERRKHETESDLRAVALTGNPEALISALTKIHVLFLIPRRWKPSAEQQHTHPTLARRIQAIRNASGLAPAALSDPVTVSGAPNSDTSVTFHADRLEWNEGPASSHTIAYQSLTEARVDASEFRVTRLIVVDAGGRRWELPLRAEDVGKVQSALDAVDTHIHPPPPVKTLASILIRLGGLFSTLAVILAGYFAPAIVTLLGVFQPTAPIVAATAATLWFTVLQLWMGRGFARNPGAAGGLIGSAIVMTWAAYKMRAEKGRPWTWRLVNSVGLLAVLALIPFGLAIDSAIQIREVATTWTVAAVLAMAFSVANAFRRGARARTASIIMALVAAACAFPGTATFVDWFVKDPLLLRAPEAAERRFEVTPRIDFTLDSYPNDIVLSPTGTALAVVDEDDDENAVVDIGHPARRLVRVEADRALFIDDQFLLVIEEQRDDAVIRKVDVDDPTTAIWEQRIDHMSESRLAIDPSRLQWRLLGKDSKSVVEATGALAGGPPQVRRWRYTGDDSRYYEALAVTSDQVLAVSTWYSPIRLPAALGRFALQADPQRLEKRFWRLPADPSMPFLKSKVEVDCLSSPIVGESPVCTAFDGVHTSLIRIDPVSGHVLPVVSFPSRVQGFDVTPDWITLRTNSEMIGIRTDTGAVFREPRERYGYVVGSERAVATIKYELKATKVRIYLAAGADTR